MGLLDGPNLLKALAQLDLTMSQDDLPDLFASVGREKEGLMAVDDFVDLVTELMVKWIGMEWNVFLYTIQTVFTNYLKRIPMTMYPKTGKKQKKKKMMMMMKMMMKVMRY
jgi:hypothetical protein